MAELRAKPNTCGDTALPWVMVTDTWVNCVCAGVAIRCIVLEA